MKTDEMTDGLNKEFSSPIQEDYTNELHSKKPKVFKDSTDKNSNTLLRIMEQRPSKLPNQLKDGSVSPAQWSHIPQSRSTSTFHNPAASSILQKFSMKFRPQTGMTYTPDSLTIRRAYLFIPQVNQDLRETKVVYTIAELLLSQAEIAVALSDWSARSSGVREFNSLEPSQREALNQIEAGRGTLFPTYFFMKSIQYTSPRTFSDLTISSNLKTSLSSSRRFSHPGTTRQSVLPILRAVMHLLFKHTNKVTSSPRAFLGNLKLRHQWKIL